MFYAHFVLSKKGPLARIWLAAHWDKKLTKANIFETDIESSVQTIMSPKTRLALRTSGHLLLGVVRIYSRKAKYLLADCNEALVRIRLAFRPGQIDLPADQLEASSDLITLRPKFYDFESGAAIDFNDRDIDPNMFAMAGFYSANQRRPEEITLREEPIPRPLTIPGINDFDNMDCGPPWDEDEVQRLLPNKYADLRTLLDRAYIKMIRESPAVAQHTSSHAISKILTPSRQLRISQADSGYIASPRDFNDEESSEGESLPSNQSFVRRKLFVDTDCGTTVTVGDIDIDVQGGGGELAMRNTLLVDVELIVGEPQADQPAATDGVLVDGGIIDNPQEVIDETAKTCPDNYLFAETSLMANKSPDKDHQETAAIAAIATDAIADQTTLLNDGSAEFALEPVTVVTGADENQTRKSKRRRRLVIDEQKVIPSDVMKRHLSHSDDITHAMDLAPPTKRMMFWKVASSVEQLMTMPGLATKHPKLLRLFQCNLVTGKKMLVDGSEVVATPRTKNSHKNQSVASEEELRRDTSHAGRYSNAAMSETRVSVAEAETGSVETTLISSVNETSVTSATTSTAKPLTRRQTKQMASSQSIEQVDPVPVMNFDNMLNEIDEDLAPLDEGIHEWTIPNDDVANEFNSGQQLVDELNEVDQEEHRCRLRTAQLHAVIQRCMRTSSTGPNAVSVMFSKVAPPCSTTRKLAAAQFNALLALKKLQIVYVEQLHPFSDIAIGPGPKFETRLG